MKHGFTEAEKKKMAEQDREANIFALCLLMPSELFLKELEREPFDLSDNKSTRLKEIAKLFGVSVNAVVARIVMLKQKMKK